MRTDLINDTLLHLARAAMAFLGSEFLAPVVRGRGMEVSVAGERYALRVVPPTFHGWGVFRPLSRNVALLIRDATGAERRQYLSFLPAVRLVVCWREGSRAIAVVANASDARFQSVGPIDVQLAADFDLFDTLIARFDGVRFWFDELVSRAEPALVAYLREQLHKRVEPREISWPGLSDGQRCAYASAYDGAGADSRHWWTDSIGVCLAEADRFDSSNFGGRQRLIAGADIGLNPR